MKKFLLKSKNSGFSLIEVAIAIVIIGIIASFAIKGKELLHTARLRSVVEQVNSVKLAVQLFYDKYGSLPGNSQNSEDFFDPTAGNTSEKITTLENSKHFWEHLQKSGLISFEISNGQPVSKIGGIFTISNDIAGKPGVWMILSSGTNDNKNFKGILTPEDAYLINRNNDNGIHNSGEIQSLQASDHQEECFSGEKYNIKNKNKDCILLFKIF